MNKISTILCILMISLGSFYGFSTMSHFIVITIGLLLLIINPISNLIRSKKKIIKNPIYHLILIGLSLYSIYIFINGIYIMFTDSKNEAELYTYNYFPLVALAFLVLFFISFIFKKTIIIKNRDNTKFILFITSIITSFRFLSFYSIYENIALVSIIAISITMIFKINDVNNRWELQKAYFILIVLHLLTYNPVGVILISNLYIQLDKNSLNF